MVNYPGSPFALHKRRANLWFHVTWNPTHNFVETRVDIVVERLIALAARFNMFAGASLWAARIGLAPDFSGSLSALMKTLGGALEE
jgi:hypothetical protein